MDLNYIMSNSLCKHCNHRATRVVSLEGLEVEYIEDGQVLQSSEDVVDDFDSFTHEFCVTFCIDLDHIVLDCSKFSEKLNT